MEGWCEVDIEKKIMLFLMPSLCRLNHNAIAELLALLFYFNKPCSSHSSNPQFLHHQIQRQTPPLYQLNAPC